MKYYEKILKIFLVITPIVFLGGLSLIFPESFGICEKGSINCGMKYFSYEELAAFISLVSILLFFLAMILFTRQKVYKAYLSWRKFALWYLPIVGIILTLSSLNNGGNGFNPGYGFDTESLTFFFSGLFALISLILIAVKSWKLRGK